MNEERDYFYRILGLRPGASQNEIKAAYRRLAKLYHPDYDQSPDTEVMYREIRKAYEKLLNWHLHNKMDACLFILIACFYTITSVDPYLSCFSAFFSIWILLSNSDEAKVWRRF